MTDDERAIRGVVEQWLAASRAGDLDTLLSLMTDDVIFMVPGSKPFGKERFAANAATPWSRNRRTGQAPRLVSG